MLALLIELVVRVFPWLTLLTIVGMFKPEIRKILANVAEQPNRLHRGKVTQDGIELEFATLSDLARVREQEIVVESHDVQLLDPVERRIDALPSVSDANPEVEMPRPPH